MKILRAAGILLGVCLFIMPAARAFDATEGSSEDLYWSDPMTVHDFKRKSDLHSIAISAMAITELQFVRLGDGLISLTTRSKCSPIARSLDSLEYAYSKLPRIEPVRRIGQLFNALQLRQISLSDARVAGSLLLGGVGGVTPIMQVRVYNVVVWLEDIISDVDRALMFPVNWGVSSLREKPTRIKTLGYVADGLGYCRWKVSAVVKYINKKIARLGSDLILDVEKGQDTLRRRKRKKLSGHLHVYARMPLSVFQENQDYFTGKNADVAAGTLPEWSAKIFTDPTLLPEDMQGADLQLMKIPADADASQEILLEADYLTWEKTPRELKKYFITPEEFTGIIRDFTSPSTQSAL